MRAFQRVRLFISRVIGREDLRLVILLPVALTGPIIMIPLRSNGKKGCGKEKSGLAGGTVILTALLERARAFSKTEKNF